MAWQQPTWVSTLISSQVQEKIASEDRRSREEVASLSRATEESIAREKNETSRYTAELSAKTSLEQKEIDRAINERKVLAEMEIAAAKRSSDEAIAEANRRSNEEIAAARRETDIEIAKINATANVSGSVIRTIPTAIPLVIGRDNLSGGSNGGGILNVGGATLKNTSPTSEKSAKEKADGLFPELEPTFGSNVGGHQVEAPGLAIAAGAGALLLGGAVAGLMGGGGGGYLDYYSERFM